MRERFKIYLKSTRIKNESVSGIDKNENENVSEIEIVSEIEKINLKLTKMKSKMYMKSKKLNLKWKITNRSCCYWKNCLEI